MEEIQQLADLEFGDKLVFPLLSLLFPFVDLRNEFHIDHVYPSSWFRKPNLLKAGIDISEVDELKSLSQRLANLQLLDGTANREKLDSLPWAWVHKQYPSEDSRSDYLDRHSVAGVTDSIADFRDFYNARRERLVAKLRSMLV